MKRISEGFADTCNNRFMTGDAKNALGVYISIPFCRSKCTYCNFASGVYPASDHVRYVERVIDDMHTAREWAAGMGAELPRRVDTIYLGGGTPSLLAPELLTRLFSMLREAFAVDKTAEITLECAPGQLSGDTLEAIAAVGVNRMSLGVQSFVDREAHASGRLHSRAVVEADLRRLRAAGITNLNVDLIAGLAGQTLASWEESLDALVDSGVPHASVYMLEVDEDSRLGREMLKGGARYSAELVPADDAIARMYEQAIERLAADGLQQYEISNFARAGYESRHNLRYWQRRPYLGLGLDASSALCATPLRTASPAQGGNKLDCVLRSTTTDHLKEYLAGPRTPETAWLDAERQHEEAWFLGLRMNAGVSTAALEQEFGKDLVAPALAVAKRLADEGLMIFTNDTLRLTARGRLISNEVFQEFLELSPHHAETR